MNEIPSTEKLKYDRETTMSFFKLVILLNKINKLHASQIEENRKLSERIDELEKYSRIQISGLSSRVAQLEDRTRLMIDVEEYMKWQKYINQQITRKDIFKF